MYDLQEVLSSVTRKSQWVSTHLLMNLQVLLKTSSTTLSPKFIAFHCIYA
ncbi:MAG: hypothetical protein ACTJH9_03425 [Pseudoalteromonas sp.]